MAPYVFGQKVCVPIPELTYWVSVECETLLRNIVKPNSKRKKKTAHWWLTTNANEEACKFSKLRHAPDAKRKKKTYSSQEKNCLFCENDWLKKRHLTSNWIRHIPRPFYDQLYCSKGAGEKTQNFFWQSIENNLDVVFQFKRYRSLAQKVPERLLTKRYFCRVNYFVQFFF